MSVPGYGSYRDSGVEWVGVFPAHWTTEPLWAVAEECDRPNVGMIESNLLSLSYGRIVQKDINDNDGLLPASFETYQIVEPDDVVWRLTDLQNDKRSLRTARVPERGIITSAYLATRPHRVAPGYFSYLLRAYDLLKVFYSMGGGLRQGMKFSDVRRLPILLPPPPEQAAIAAFLDRETGKIDALVEAQRRLIELLKEKRQSVISHAVTKGLDPAAPMKASGAEWLGEVPAHWEVRKLLTVLLSAPCYGVLVPDNDPDGVPMMRIMDMSDGRADPSEFSTISPALSRQYSRTILSVGDLALSVVGTIGTSLIADEALAGVNLSRAIARLQFNDDCSPHFARWLFESDAFRTFVDLVCVGSAQRVLNMDDLRAVRFPFPSPQEQGAICDYLSTAVAGLEALASQAAAAAVLLQERRAALISAAVTGKIDVRGLAPEQAEAA